MGIVPQLDFDGMQYVQRTTIIFDPFLFLITNLQTGVGQTSHRSLLEQFVPISSSKPQSPEIESKSSVHKLYHNGH